MNYMEWVLFYNALIPFTRAKALGKQVCAQGYIYKRAASYETWLQEAIFDEIKSPNIIAKFYFL